MKRLYIVIVLIVFSYIGYTIYRWTKYSYSTEFNDYHSYLNLFAENQQSKVDTFPFFIQLIRESDVLSHYNLYKGEYSVFIWELKNLTNFDVKKVQFQTKSSFQNDEDCSWGDKLFSDSSPTIFVASQEFIKERLIIDLGNNALIKERFNSENYKGVIGQFNDIYLKDNSQFTKVHFNYGDKLHRLIVLSFKKMNKFYLIIMESKDGIKKEDIALLALK